MGETILVRLPDGSWGVVDHYTSSPEPAADSPALAYLRSRGVDSLRFFCWTHPDDDHSRGVRALLARFPDKIDSIWLFDGVHNERLLAALDADLRKRYAKKKPSYYLALYGELKRRLKSTRYEYVNANAPLLDLGEVKISGLAPSPEMKDRFNEKLARLFAATGVEIDRRVQYHNDISSALLIEYGAARVVLGGDVTALGWENSWPRVATRNGPSVLVKASHHGSEHSYFETAWNTWESKTAARPTTIVVTPFKRVPLPSEEGLKLLSRHGQVYTTGAKTPDHFPAGPGWSFLSTFAKPHSTTPPSGSAHFRVEVNPDGKIVDQAWL
ncbi:MAG: hypothetical protein KC910_28415 [Candidatus Eremiobacteraeota bacterium]|nr:hypothetical protein [Candidatus Eremiobacteraeota bacterium]